MAEKIEVSYKTTLPKIGNSPCVTVHSKNTKEYLIKIIDTDTNEFCYEQKFLSNEVVSPNLKQYFTNWCIKVYDTNNNLLLNDKFDVTNKTVFIKMDAYALGDNIAWIPYVELFRRVYNCQVICSTFHNNLFIKTYPNIMFVKPNTVIDNVYAQYYIGASNDDNLIYSPIKVNEHPLQKVASSILGLNHMEIRPKLESQFAHMSPRFDFKYVCISEYGSSDIKHWKVENGWQSVVDFLNDCGYKVLVISKEPTSLINVIDLTGDIPLEVRAIDLIYADFFIGISSGLSWLSWAVGTHTVLISDVTPIWHEFSTDITRISANILNTVNYEAENQTTIEKVLSELSYLVV